MMSETVIPTASPGMKHTGASTIPVTAAASSLCCTATFLSQRSTRMKVAAQLDKRDSMRLSDREAKAGMKNISEVNLDKLLNDFSQIEKKISELHGKNNLLSLQLDKTNRLLTRSQSEEKSSKEECAALRSVIKGLQQTIESQCNLRDENEKMKNTARLLEEKLKAHEQEYKSHIEKLVREIKSKEEKHKLEQRQALCDMNKKLETKEEEHKLQIEKKDQEILELTRQLRAQERENQNEIIKLQIEFSAKLARIQNKTPKSYTDPSACPQNIYKRKLQHLQEQKNKEIEILRNTIRDLEQKLSKGQDTHFKRRPF